MKKSIKPAVLFIFIVFLIPAFVLPQQVSLTILHTNDTHGRLLPFSYPSTITADSPLAKLKTRKDIGGIARRATLVKRLREELQRKKTAVWLVDAGDFSDGTPFSVEYHGEADVAAMNAAAYDYGTLGNHEFNQPLSKLKNLLAMFRFPVLCANVLETATGGLLTRSSEIREIGPLKIGIFGLTTLSAATYPAARDGLLISGEIETSRRMVDALRKEAGIVIAISHAGEQVDEKIAAAIPGLDIIVGGHSHSRLPFGEFVQHAAEAQKINGTIIVQAHQWGGELGRLDLTFNKDKNGLWQIERYRARLLPVKNSIPEDKAAAEAVERYWKPISARYGEIIGKAAADFAAMGDDLAQYNLVSDAIRETFGTEIELENLGGVRAELQKGSITRWDLASMDPFDNTIITFKISGRLLRKVLQKELPAVSGLRYRVENGNLADVIVSGKPLNDDKLYTAASNSYFGRVALKEIDIANTGKQRLDVVIDYIRKKQVVRPAYDGRRIIIAPENPQNHKAVK